MVRIRSFAEALIYQVQKKRRHSLNRAPNVELGHDLGPAAACSLERRVRVGERGRERLRQLSGVARVGEQTRFAIHDQFRHAREPGRHHGNSAREALDQGNRKTLHLTVRRDDAGEHEQVGAVEQMRDRRLVAAAFEVDARGDSEIPGETCERLTQLTISDQIEGQAFERARVRERSKKDLVTLVFLEARNAEGPHGPICRRRTGPEAIPLGVDAAVDQVDRVPSGPPP